MTRNALVIAASVLLLLGCQRTNPVDEITRVSTASDEAESISVSEGDWPWWWGPKRNGKSIDRDVPTVWSKTENVVWTAGVEGRGHSSPCIWGPRIFISTADDESQKQMTLCFDRETGQRQWKRVIHDGGFMKSHKKNSHASATMACDGDRVFAVFINHGALAVTAIDLMGNILWQKDAGPFGSEHGYGSSPVLYRSFVIVAADNMTGSFVAALDRETGDVVWRTRRPTTGAHGSYATPIVAKVAGRTQLLIMGMSQVSSYDPDRGKLIWSCKGPAEVTACATAYSEELVFASGGYPEKELLAIRGDGSGDVTDSHVVWRARKGVTYVPSPLVHEGNLYLVNDDGIVSCFRADTGERLNQKRLGGNFSASPILASDRFYVPDESGLTYVIGADPTLNVLAKNDLGNGGFASLAICGGQIFIRSENHLYCIGQSAPERAAMSDVSRNRQRSLR